MHAVSQLLNQVIPFPGATLTPNPVDTSVTARSPKSLLPPFTSVASFVDMFAKRIPWYAWLMAGGYLAYRIFKK